MVRHGGSLRNEGYTPELVFWLNSNDLRHFDRGKWRRHVGEAANTIEGASSTTIGFPWHPQGFQLTSISYARSRGHTLNLSCHPPGAAALCISYCTLRRCRRPRDVTNASNARASSPPCNNSIFTPSQQEWHADRSFFSGYRYVDEAFVLVSRHLSPT